MKIPKVLLKGIRLQLSNLFPYHVFNKLLTGFQLPSAGSYPGHHRDSYLVAFFPVAKASWYFTSCRNLGYDYDSLYEPTTDFSIDGEGTVKNTTSGFVNKTSDISAFPDASTVGKIASV